MSTWVFLRGLTRERRHWGDFPSVFQRHVSDAQVLTLDLPGNGHLHDLESPRSVPAMAEFCRMELSKQNVKPPYYLLAMSLGAMVAVAWADAYPAELRGCVLINTSLRPFSPFYRRLRPANYVALMKLALLPASDRVWEEAVLRATSRLVEAPEDLLREWIAYRREYPVSRVNAIRQLIAAARFRAPPSAPIPGLLVLSSARDAFVDPRCSKQLAMQWNVPLVEHPSAGHDLPLDDGGWVARQVRDWL